MSSILQPKIATFIAGGAIAKGKAVKLSSGKVVACSANTDKAIGICQNAPAADGDYAEVAMPGGGALASCDGTVAEGKWLVPSSDGQLEQTNAAGDIVIAQALEAGVANDLISVVVLQAAATKADE